MAKKAKKANKATRASKGGRKAKTVMSAESKASAIVAEVLASFGGGYEAERQSETPAAPTTPAPLFANVNVAQTFHFALFESTMRNFASIDWDSPLGAKRAQVLSAAFKHGRLARQEVKKAGGALTSSIIFSTLETIKKSDCPSPTGGAGGGLVCDF